MRTRYRIEGALSLLCGALFLITLISREWIEALTGWDPDHGSGSLEWGLVVVLGVAAAAFAFAARTDRQRARSQGSIVSG